MMDDCAQREPSEVLDPEALAQLRALRRPGRPSLVLRIIGLFRQDGPRHVAAMEEAVGGCDMETLHRAAHTLKSSAANLGATDLRACCQGIESAARSGKAEAAAQLVAELPALLAVVLSALDLEGEAEE